jgi:uncharacterized protein (DUF1810 family)
MTDHDLDRFVRAQGSGAYDTALAELRDGRKRTHWVWFVFPQVEGLGSSPSARMYAVSGLSEARAYLAHPVLGDRLRECAQVLSALPANDPEEVMGSGIDAVKLRSSMTLFARAAESDADRDRFRGVLEKYFADTEDPATLERLGVSGR